MASTWRTVRIVLIPPSMFIGLLGFLTLATSARIDLKKLDQVQSGICPSTKEHMHQVCKPPSDDGKSFWDSLSGLTPERLVCIEEYCTMEEEAEKKRQWVDTKCCTFLKTIDVGIRKRHWPPLDKSVAEMVQNLFSHHGKSSDSSEMPAFTNRDTCTCGSGSTRTIMPKEELWQLQLQDELPVNGKVGIGLQKCQLSSCRYCSTKQWGVCL